MTRPCRCLVMGAAGRDFHDFQTFFAGRPEFQVCAFTATQIPFIARREFPRQLAGPHYADAIPIYPETELSALIARFDIDMVFLAYSDLSHQEVMHKASIAQAAGAGFALLGPKQTQLPAKVPVVAVVAARTGAGKSPLSQALAKYLHDSGRRVAIVRHPMPYGDLSRQQVQHFAAAEDLDRFACTIEEREEYEPYLQLGLSVWAGVDYRRIVAAAQREADVLLWDGGNNDYPFIRPGLTLVVLDALRAGHELEYYPGETNFRAADVLVINKVGQATAEAVAGMRQRAAKLNPAADLLESDLEVSVDRPQAVRGRRVLVVEDGPTLTHGGMASGAGLVAAHRFAAGEVIDPRPHALGSIRQAFEDYPQIAAVLPALGYSTGQRAELIATINACRPDVVLDASPAALDRFLTLPCPVVRVRYRWRQVAGRPITQIVDSFLDETKAATR